MPLIFVNGSSPDYMGQVFTTASQLIDGLEQGLVAAGWLTIEKSGSGPALFMSGTSNNGHQCYVEFRVSPNPDVTNGFFLDQRGFLESSRSNGSPINILRHTFVNNKPNRMWLAADNDSGCLSILDATDTMRGSHFGFLNRLDQQDPNAWMVGWIHADGHLTAYVARSGFNNTIWRRLSDDHSSMENIADLANVTSSTPFSTFDFLQRGGFYTQSLGWTSAANPWHNGRYGRINTTGRPVIDPYYYQEGRGSTTNYAGTPRPPLYFRGFVKHAFCGMASLPQGSQVVDTDGNRILSVGPTYWQGMRIL